MIKLAKLFSALIVILTITISNSVLAAKISGITIIGNQRVENATIKEYFGLEIGDIFSESAKSKAIKSLYGSALFENISISQNQAGLVKIIVEETPFVTKVEFQGNNKIKADLLENEMQIVAGDNLRKNRLKADISKIREIYRRNGHFAARIESKIENQPNNRVKVIFDIKEGPKTTIKKIHFSGNEHYRDGELQAVILTKESKWFRFLETNDVFDPDRVEYDKYLLKKFYNSVGFADFRIISVTANLLPTRDGFTINISLDEGEKYQFGEMKLINKLADIDTQYISKFAKFRKGQTYNADLIERISKKISNHLASAGYPQVEVRHELEQDRTNKIVNVTMIIDQAERVFVDHINIEGNLKTEGHIIRREMKIAEGDVFNRSKINDSERRIRNLDFFEKVSLSIEPTKKKGEYSVNKYDVNIAVEEKSTASIALQGSYDTSSGPFGEISFLEKNFVGTGKLLNVSAKFGKKNLLLNFGVTNPRFMDRDLAVGFDLFHKRNGKNSGLGGGEQNFIMNSTGVNFTAGYNLADNLAHTVEYSFKNSNLQASAETTKSLLIKENEGKFTTSAFIRENEGKIITSAFSHRLIYDQTDSVILSKNGYSIILNQELAGFGGNNKYFKNEGKLIVYRSLWDNEYTAKFILSAGRIDGIFGEKVKISDRFNLGDHSLRGFAGGGIGPRDKKTKESLGGQKYYSFSAELNLPLGLPEEYNVRGALFMDMGTLWDMDSEISKAGFYNEKSLRASVGFGVIWKTKIAPIRLDWGFPILKEKFDETQTLHIKFSTQV